MDFTLLPWVCTVKEDVKMWLLLTHSAAPCLPLIFFYHILTFSVTLFLNRWTATWNLVVKYTIFFIILSWVIQEKLQNLYHSLHYNHFLCPWWIESLVVSINFVPKLIWLWYHCKYFKGLSITWLQVCIFSLNFHNKSYVHLFLQA